MAPPATLTIDLVQLENDRIINENCLIHGMLKSNSIKIAKSLSASARSLHFLHCVSNSDLKSINLINQINVLLQIINISA